MAQFSFILLVAVASAISVSCGATTSTQERQPDSSIHAGGLILTPKAVSVHGRPADVGIRRDLTLAIARDVDLANRGITFIVANGDVSVTGIVRTEDERKKVNDLAMNVDGVRSVANALRVAEESQAQP